MADTADFNPEFQKRLDSFRSALTAAGINTHVISGYRSPEQQAGLYTAYKAGKGNVAAPAWRSFHNYGLAADVTPDNPADYQRMWSMAPKYGLTALGSYDKPHFQLAGTLDQDIKQYNLAGWRPSSMPAPSQGAIAYGGPPPGQPPPTLVNRGTPSGSAYGSPFVDSLAQIESNNRNIYSGVDKDYPGQPNSRSQGYFQIDTPTWGQFAAAAGIDVNKYPNARSAPPEVQAQVASLIPLARFGGRTQKMLAQQYGQLDTSKPIGELARGTTLTSTPIEQGIGSGYPTPAAPNPTAVAAETPPQNAGDWIKKLTTRPEPTKDAQGNEVQGKSPLEKLTSAIPGKPAGQQQPAAPEPAQFAPVQDPTAQLAGPAGQLFAQTQAASAKPLSWSSRPYGWDAGQQMVPGMTLNSAGYG